MRVRSALVLLSGFVGLSVLTGCTFSAISPKADPITSPTVVGSTITGTAHGGQQPIVGGRVYLLAAANPSGTTAGPTGSSYGITAPSASNASISLLNPSSPNVTGTDSIGAYVSTTSTGGFQLAGDYACATGYAQSTGTSVILSGSELVYILVLGGNSGSGAQNASTGLMAALGPCNALFSTKLSLNEITTVATAYALAGYATDATHINSDYQTVFSSQGIYYAFATIQNLVNLSTGTVLTTTPNGNGTVPAAKFITLADILAACVNSNGTNGNCTTLFASAKSLGLTGTTPTDTATAAINLAHNPAPSAAAVATLFGLLPPTPAFTGGLTSQPNDFTLAISYTGGGLNGVNSLAIDLNSNIWASSQYGNSISEFSPLGVPSSASPITGGSINSPESIVFDTNSNLWIANGGGNSLSDYNISSSSFGTVRSSTTYPMSLPYSLTVDSGGVVYASSLFTSNAFAWNGYFPIGVSCSFTASPFAYSIAADANSNIWMVNFNQNSITECNYNSSVLSPYPSGFQGGGMNGPEALAVDGTGNIWVANLNANVLSKFDTNGNALSGNGYTGGGLAGSLSLALDGSGRVWVSNGSSLSAFDSNGNPLSPATGYIDSSLSNAKSVTIDGSGNLWVANSLNGKTITEFIGAATPVYQPLVYGLNSGNNGNGSSNLGTRP